MKRLMLCLLLAAPLGCSSAGGPWLKEVEMDPDLQTNLWGANGAPNKDSSDSATAPKK